MQDRTTAGASCSLLKEIHLPVTSHFLAERRILKPHFLYNGCLFINAMGLSLFQLSIKNSNKN